MFLPEASSFALGRQALHASEILLNDAHSISRLLYLLVQLFSDVQSVGMESTQYRKYILSVLCVLWHDPRSSDVVVRMKKDAAVVQRFAQALIVSFSKLTDDAFAAIPEIKALTAQMLEPEFAKLEEKERDEKQLRLTQLERSVRFSFDLTHETLQLLLDAAKPWGVGTGVACESRKSGWKRRQSSRWLCHSRAWSSSWWERRAFH